MQFAEFGDPFDPDLVRLGPARVVRQPPAVGRENEVMGDDHGGLPRET
jgi:hypothetical protein